MLHKCSAETNVNKEPSVDGAGDCAIPDGCRNPNPMTDPLYRFDLVAAELRALGLTLRRLPGEYCVNFPYGGDKTARMAEELDQALELGRAMAAERAANRATTTKPPRSRRRRRMTPKAQRRRFIRRHNRRLRARARRRHPKKT